MMIENLVEEIKEIALEKKAIAIMRTIADTYRFTGATKLIVKRNDLTSEMIAELIDQGFNVSMYHSKIIIDWSEVTQNA